MKEKNYRLKQNQQKKRNSFEPRKLDMWKWVLLIEIIVERIIKNVKTLEKTKCVGQEHWNFQNIDESWSLSPREYKWEDKAAEASVEQRLIFKLAVKRLKSPSIPKFKAGSVDGQRWR